MPSLIVVQVYFLVRKMSEPEKMLKPIEGGLSANRERFVESQKTWLDSNELQRLTSFQFGAIQSVVFQQKGAQRFFIFHFHQKNTFEIESRFSEDSHLETSNSGSSGMFPARPKVYKQSFPGMTPEQLWQRHLEGEAYAMGKFSIAWHPLNQPYEQILINSLRMTMNYVRSIPFYPFRALYWYFVTRNLVNNRTIQQQFS
ncbi:MAG TPA: hypothetical protein VK815_16640 [Candidatus Acidoferrales bacterium]|jgi:hypothetical protein|nr:hypothetical protein [Candidatus Acidoferrales bacterium]